ncbi:hypothetical protein ABPG75_011752 [Micractinium tetrahymenae]
MLARALIDVTAERDRDRSTLAALWQWYQGAAAVLPPDQLMPEAVAAPLRQAAAAAGIQVAWPLPALAAAAGSQPHTPPAAPVPAATGWMCLLEEVEQEALQRAQAVPGPAAGQRTAADAGGRLPEAAAEAAAEVALAQAVVDMLGDTTAMHKAFMQIAMRPSAAPANGSGGG